MNVVFAFDHFAREFVTVSFKHATCDFERRVEHRVEDKSAVLFHVDACALGGLHEAVALDFEARGVRMTFCDIESKVFPHPERDKRAVVLRYVIFTAFGQSPFFVEVELFETALFEYELAIECGVVRSVRFFQKSANIHSFKSFMFLLI